MHENNNNSAYPTKGDNNFCNSSSNGISYANGGLGRDVITGTNEDDVINGCAETTRLMDLMEMTGLKAAEAMAGYSS